MPRFVTDGAMARPYFAALQSHRQEAKQASKTGTE